MVVVYNYRYNKLNGFEMFLCGNDIAFCSCPKGQNSGVADAE